MAKQGNIGQHWATNGNLTQPNRTKTIGFDIIEINLVHSKEPHLGFVVVRERTTEETEDTNSLVIVTSPHLTTTNPK